MANGEGGVALKTKEASALLKQTSRFKESAAALFKNKAATIGLIFIAILLFVAVFGNFLMPYDPISSNPDPLNPKPPNAEHIFGTDEQGRDIFSRVIDGTKVSLFVGITSVLLSLFFGTTLGAIAGFYAGKVDTIIMRFMDIMLSVPSMLFAISLMVAFGPGIDKAIISIGIVAVPQYARIVRGSVLSEKENDYVWASRIIGSSDFSILFKGILPNIASSIIIRATLGVSIAILDVAALGFLGLGVQPPQAEWGTMLSSSKKFVMSAPHTLLFPGAAITLTVLAFNLLGDGLRDALDPKSRK